MINNKPINNIDEINKKIFLLSLYLFEKPKVNTNGIVKMKNVVALRGMPHTQRYIH